MDPENKTPLQRELIDDFCAEADEHLKQIREALTLLEQPNGADPTIIEELFRNFHSFKGISAIVGLRSAEALAHTAEEIFRHCKKARSPLSGKAVETLMEVAQKLEETVVALRSGGALPNVDFLLASLRESAAASTAPKALFARFTFVPGQELDQRGIHINSVRERISALGRIVRATPQVRGEGQIAFEFDVQLTETLSDLSAWASDGITVAALEEEAPAGESPSERSAAEPAQSLTPFVAPSHVMRVDLDRLDELMRITGELVIHRSRLEERLNHAHRGSGQMDLASVREFNLTLGRSLRQLREAIMRIRLVPVGDIFSRMAFVVSDLARGNKKQARLIVEGQQTELDKYVLERLKDPLLHLVRNAFSHGVETPEERLAAGKPPTATILLRASSTGDSAVIQVRDDGCGIDPASVALRARAQGLTVPDKLNTDELLKILCAPGFSTRDDADRAAGRGVGMAVVARAVGELGGSITLESKLGQWTQFTLRLPLTLAIAETFIVSSGEQTCAIPQSCVSEVMHVETDQIRVINRVEVMPYRTGALPVTRLSSLFHLPASPGPRLCMLVLRSERGSSGLLVDRIHGQREVVVRAIRDPLGQAPGVVGATELGDGRPVLILDGEHLTRGAVRPHTAEEVHGN